MPPADGSDSSNPGPDFDLEGQQIEMGRQTGSTVPQKHVEMTTQSHQQLLHADEGAGAAGGGSDGGQVSNSQPRQTVAIIPKVRKQLRRAAGDYVFTPQVMLIGPYHKWEDYYSFPWMDEKKKVVDHLERLMGDDRFGNLKTMLAQLWPQEVRRFYTHLTIHDQEQDEDEAAAFASMLLHDGCYLLSLFFKFEEQRQRRAPPGNSEGGGGTDDQTTDPIDNTLVRDILYLLENQIPMFVLQKILNHIIPGLEETAALNCIASNVTTLLQTQLYISNRGWTVPSDLESSDLLHLVHSYFRDPRPGVAQAAAQPGCWPRVARQQRITGKWRRATDYSRYANLQFNALLFSEDGARTILDIDLRGGTLWMPRLRVDSNTWTMLRNLMALEEQKDKQRPVTAYCLFMSQVACTAEDVELLQRAKVLEHFLGTDEQAAKGFAELCDGVVFDIDKADRNYLRKMWHDLDERCRKPENNFQGFFRQRYCGNMFQRMVFFMALILNICQMVQAIYAVVGYQKPPK